MFAQLVIPFKRFSPDYIPWHTNKQRSEPDSDKP